jgi:hypothetical protein
MSDSFAPLQKYDNITRGVLCDGVASVIKEGHKSFPSGLAGKVSRVKRDFIGPIRLEL